MFEHDRVRPMSHISPRASAALVAIAAWFGLALQTYLTVGVFLDQGGTLGDALWRLAGYFTLLTNLLTALVMTAIAFNAWPGGQKPSASVLAAVTLYIATVGVVYHLLLRNVWAPEGLQKIADIVLHYVVPVGAVMVWLCFVPKSQLKARSVPFWLVYPLAYCAYALARGSQDGWYPYPFLDVTALGFDAVLQNAAGLTVALAIAGLALVGLARMISRRLSLA